MSADYVAKPQMRVLHALAGLAAHHRKMWCFPSYETIKNILATRYHFAISERSLARHIGALCEQGYIERQRRHKRGKDGKLELHSTLYILKSKAAAAIGQLSGFLAMLKGRHWAQQWIKPLINATSSTATSGSMCGSNPNNYRKKDKTAQDSRKRE